MAEIFLGRLLGPSGFERAVVIKRILPHLAEVPDFVDMFLDEGRIAGRIGHPNVAQVFELNREDDELYQVMEYLQGEGASGLQRRVRALNRTLDVALAAHIVAEACAGLHAAHELRNVRGEPLRLVHRDISPDNIFIGYDGTVKVLDFGIAKAAGRLTKTDVGTVKGKFSYMSPEQTDGRALDRRSDIFALGIVLYELSTQRRLFRRGSPAATIRAVTEEPIIQPSRIVADYPSALESVCMKALERDPEDRFESAKEMQVALLNAMRTFGAPALPGDALGTLMTDLFPDRIEEKEQMLRRMQDGHTPTHIPLAEADRSVDLPSVGGDFFGTAGDPAPRRWPVLMGLGVVLCISAIFAWVFTRDVGSDNAPVTAAANNDVTRALTPVVPDEHGQAPISVTLDVQSVPTGASVSIGGAERGTTPVAIDVPQSDAPLTLRVERSGYEPADTVVVPSTGRIVEVTLTPRRRRSSMRARRRPTTMADAPEESEPSMMSSRWRRFN